MAYNTLISKPQLQRIHKALEHLDKVEPLTAEEREDPNLEGLTDVVAAVLEQPDDQQFLYGISL